MAFKSKYGLEDLRIGETKSFEIASPDERRKIKRSAHNYNQRTELYFVTRYHRGVMTVTRIR
jgi:hypothetical protein